MQDNNLWDVMDERLPTWNAPRVVAMRYWSAEDVARLIKLAEAQATTRQIAIELGRTPLAIRLTASRMGLALTAHEVRRSARRHARREGKAALAQVKTLRQRPRIVMTVDFDLTSLTRSERLQLAERLRVLQAAEDGVASVEETSPPVVASPPRRRLQIPAPYDPSAQTPKRLRERYAKREEKRASLGWMKPGRQEPEGAMAAKEVGARAGAVTARRRPERAREERATVRRGKLASDEGASGASVVGRELEALLRGPAVGVRAKDLEDGVRGVGGSRCASPSTGDGFRSRKLLGEA